MAETATTGSRIVAGSPRYAMLQIQVDQKAIDRMLQRIAGVPKAAARVMPTALNRAADETLTVLYRVFSARMNVIRKTSIRDRLIRKPQASRVNWAAGVQVALTRLTVASFKGTRQRKEGVQWSPEAGRVQIIPRAFLQQGLTHYKTGEYMDIRQAWRRAMTGEKGFYPSRATRAGNIVRRYPIKLLRGPSLGRVFSDDPAFQADVERQGGAILEKKVAQQVDRIVAEGTK